MSMFPKSSPKAEKQDSSMQGTLVLYEQSGTPVLGVVLDFRKQKHLLLNDRGREAEILPTRLHPLPGRLPPEITGTDKRAEYLAKIMQNARAQALEVDLHEIWSFLNEEQREFSNEELCRIYYGENALQKHLGLRLALIDDKVFFKRKKELFIPRTPEIVEELRKAGAARAEKELLIDQTVKAVKLRLADEQTELTPTVLKHLALLEGLAANMYEGENSQVKDAKDLLIRIREGLELELAGKPEQAAFDLLVRIGQFSPDQNLSLIRNGFPTEYSQEAEEFAQALIVPTGMDGFPDPQESILREDLTGTRTFTIDDATTRDMDDALSIERLPDRYRVGIHISDVANLLAKDCPLEDEIKARTTSIYLPEGTFPMLPRLLAEEKCSLLAGSIRPCISCLLEFDHQFNLIKWRIAPSLIRIAQGLSYDEAESLLENGDQDLCMLYDIAAARESERIAAGAVRITKREAGVEVAPNGEVSIYEINESTPARMLVGEMMILANTISAEFAATNGLALFFRGQEQPDEDIAAVGAHLPDGPARAYALRGKLKPSSTTPTPAAHAGLAVAAYAQVTSPIRRYSDLINQRQMFHYLRHGTPLYSAEEISVLIAGTVDPLKSAVLINRETRRYWLLKYLKQLSKKGPVLKGIAVRCDMKYPLIELEQVYLTTVLRTERTVALGEEVEVKIAKVVPREDYLRVEPI